MVLFLTDGDRIGRYTRVHFYTKIFFTDAFVENVFYCINSVFPLCILKNFYKNPMFQTENTR